MYRTQCYFTTFYTSRIISNKKVGERWEQGQEWRRTKRNRSSRMESRPGERQRGLRAPGGAPPQSHSGILSQERPANESLRPPDTSCPALPSVTDSEHLSSAGSPCGWAGDAQRVREPQEAPGSRLTRSTSQTARGTPGVEPTELPPTGRHN